MLRFLAGYCDGLITSFCATLFFLTTLIGCGLSQGLFLVLALLDDLSKDCFWVSRLTRPRSTFSLSLLGTSPKNYKANTHNRICDHIYSQEVCTKQKFHRLACALTWWYKIWIATPYPQLGTTARLELEACKSPF